MSVKMPEAVQIHLAEFLLEMEETSELTRCVVVTRTGIKIAPDMDADSYSASSAALIDLGERVVASLEHGTLEELVINAIGGYVILAAVGKEYMLLGATPAAMKMGYYLPFIRKKAWELEGIIYGAKGSSPGKDAASKTGTKAAIPVSQDAPKITMKDIKAADIRAMNDVLAAFDEFGINDDFTKSLGDEAVPSVGISTDEMATISQQIKQEPEAVAEAASKIVSTPSPAAIKKPEQEFPSTQTTSECPIPLEPGEVPPIALSTEELVTTTEVAPVPTAPAFMPPEVIPETPVALPVTRPAPATAGTRSGSKPEPPADTNPVASKNPVFTDASEYDFEFDGSKPPEKDVVIPEQDSMSDTLKALGWEEDEDEK
jgi:predicted regulator of Ras-like GTPase activity (Roadblock/LC7/MglB family)